MALRLAPFSILMLAATTALAAAAACLFIALSQPWLGVGLAVDHDTGQVRIRTVAPDGPAAALPIGTAIDAIGGITISAGDLVEEPDVAESYASLRMFFERQDALHAALSASTVHVASGGNSQELAPGGHRPLTDLPLVFWVQILAGFTCLMVGAWVWSLRRSELSATLLLIAGTGISAAAFAASAYSSREIALPGDVFRTLSAINHLGALAFGVAMALLFLVYPRRLAPLWFLWVLPAAYSVIWALDTGCILLPGPAEGYHLPTVILMAGILAGAIWQYRASRADPAARAAVRWFALSVGLCAGTFVTVVLMPNLFGLQPAVSQGYAFVLFAMLFVGVGAGVARYRLFELESWAFSVLGYFSAVLLLVLLDAVLISFVALERPAAFALSLLTVALVYLPFRERLARWLMPKRELDREALFGHIIDVALTPAADRTMEWRRVLQGTFRPLQINPSVRVVREPTIAEEGLALDVPGIAGLPPLRMSYAHAGQRLFSPQDRGLAAEICTMLAHAIASRDAHERGATEERTRIARDMHDNLGAQLLSALYSPAPDRKDMLIRETISDLRDIVNNAARGGKTLEEVLADLKVEALERLSAADIRLDWHDDCEDGNRMLSPNAAHSLRSILREIISNTIRHSGAGRLRLSFEIRDGIVDFRASDDGRGLAADTDSNGNGLSNIEARLLALKGTLALEDAKPGLTVSARFPLLTGEMA